MFLKVGKHPTHRSGISDCETVGSIYCKVRRSWVSLPQRSAFQSARADRLTALALTAMVMASWGWHAPSDSWRYPDSSLRVDLRLRETSAEPETRLVHDLRERTSGR